MKKGIDHIGNAIVFFCHDGRGNFVLAKRTTKTRDEHGTWDPGGGGINFKEPVHKTLERELKEEYCVDIIKQEFLGFRDVHRIDHKGRKTHWITLDFKVLVNPKKVKIGEPRNHSELRWFRLNNLPKPLHSQFLNFIKQYKNKLK